MDYEKKYKEALERARANYKADKEIGFLENCDMLELIFPELTESEDERMIKWLHYLIEIAYTTDLAWDISKDDTLAWLEKQKEQEGMITVSKEAWDENAKDSFERGIKVGMIRQQKEQWLTAKINGEPIPTEDYSVNIPLAEWSDEDGDNLERVDNYLWMLDDYVGDDCAMPQGKTDKIRGNIQGILSPWLKSLPERFNLQSKQEWSEEDEKMMKDIDLALRKLYDASTRLRIETWLKSLRPSWKPSEEQMEALNYAIAEWDGGKKLEGLYALRTDLKKL